MTVTSAPLRVKEEQQSAPPVINRGKVSVPNIRYELFCLAAAVMLFICTLLVVVPLELMR